MRPAFLCFGFAARMTSRENVEWNQALFIKRMISSRMIAPIAAEMI
jgi:hypothetical protein